MTDQQPIAKPHTRRQWLFRGGLIVGGLIVAVILFLAFLGSSAGVMKVNAETPPTVTVGEPFEVTLVIENTSGSPHSLISIGIEKALLDQGLEVQRMVPGYRKADNVNGSRWTEFTFSIARRPVLEGHESLPMRLTLVATRPGHLSGSITVWTENRLRTDYASFDVTAVEN